MMVFAVIDPAELQSFGGSRLAWSTEAVYTIAFLAFWAAVAAASAVTTLLSLERKELNGLPESR